MKLFDTLVCSIADIRYVVSDYLQGYLSKKQPLPIDVVEEFKRNISDYIRDFRPYTSSDSKIVNSPRRGTYTESEKKIYSAICALVDENKLTTKNLSNYLGELLNIEEIKNCVQKNKDIIISNGQLFGPQPQVTTKTKIKTCRVSLQGNDTDVYISFSNLKGHNEKKDIKHLLNGEHIYATALDYENEDNFVFCEILDNSIQKNNTALKFTDKNTEQFGSILKIFNLSDSLSLPIQKNNVISATILDNGEVIWIDYRGKLYANGHFAPKIKSILCDNIPERLVYVKGYEDFVLVLSENGRLGMVNINTCNCIKDDNIYWTNFITQNECVVLEVRRFDKDRDEIEQIPLSVTKK